MSNDTPKAKLKFNKNIISTTENPIPTPELLNRLTILHDELMSLVQDQVDIYSLEKYRIDLINKKLLKHRDLGVRSFTACCISDILRLYAPDAPFTQQQLTDYFKLVISQFKLLGDNENNGFIIQQTYLITRLLEFRSIVLITDLPNSLQLIEQVFQIFYNDSLKFPIKLYNVLGGILGEIISEFENLPMSILKLIFNKILTYPYEEISNTAFKKKTPALSCSYEITLILSNTYSSRMSRHLTKYYSEILYSITNKNIEEPNYISSKSIQFNILEKLNKLVINIWLLFPEMLSSIIGFIYHELCSEDEILRLKSTKLVSELLSRQSSNNASINFISSYKDCYDAWLLKIADIDVDVRIQWVESIPKLLSCKNSMDLASDLNKALSKTLVDNDFKVRKSSVMIFVRTPIHDIWKILTNPLIYSSLLYLTREKVKEVREISILAVSQFFSSSLKHIERNSTNKPVWDILDTIPSVLFNLYYINDLNINEQVDLMVFKYILPIDSNEKTRILRLLHVLKGFDKKAFSSFFAFNRRQLQMSIALNKFLQFSKLLNTNIAQSEDERHQELETIRVKYQKVIDWLANTMSDREKTVISLETIKNLNDQRIFFLLETCTKSDVNFTTLKNSFSELMSKLQDPQLFKKHKLQMLSNIIPKDIAKQLEILLYRSSPVIYNISNVNALLNLGDSIDKLETETKQKLLDEISTVNPALFKDQLLTLKDIICDPDFYVNDTKEKSALYDALKTLYKTSKVLTEQNPLSSDNNDMFISRLKDISLEGSPFESKYAIKLISKLPDSETIMKELKTLVLPLNVGTCKNFASHIVVLTEIFKAFPHIVDDESTDIISYLIKEVLLSNQVVGEDDEASGWVEEQELSRVEYLSLVSKLAVLKLFTNKLKVLASENTDNKSTEVFILKTMKLFFYLIASGGELIAETNKENYPTPAKFQTRLRCQAGLQVLKLAKNHKLSQLITPTDVNKLINLVEDECLSVRKIFLKKLKDYISNELISIKFFPLIFFTAYEPDTELKADTKKWVNYTFTKESFKNGTYLERTLPRLIHAIAHHSDIIEGFESEEDDDLLNALINAIDYLIFYFDSIAAQENFNLLYYLSERVKNYQDKITDDNEGNDDGTTEEENMHNSNQIFETSKRMYMVSELAQMVLLQLKEKRNWQHSAYPGKLNLSSDIFLPFISGQETRTVLKTYLPDKFAAKLQNNIRTKVHRITHTSQTQRQRAQKRMLETEHIEASKKKKHESKSLKKKRSVADDDSESEGSNSDENYDPSGKSKAYRTTVKKNLRQRKKVNYNDGGSSGDEDNSLEYMI
ncbi:hypothetical protein TBLA_0G02290 [Henningerozyma blattae CBS 6284]|uniref:Sister chromatid cohesion protein PDS5 n=1 Tax=Henningerozyma blattae (strain ATCC 34711 / CBS 6284 / DSM 70876 / NBRC 10599 / NRRL Y-10934 / UCD 77-7) TaxID=1071380 RepID=I2H717_HENB6|nr:hypothetical protein TBLA_0G02290 [Tetrapisispora blattae CBS 6284]CCH62169.1 hypothetical protein TBLA_0G02290 [Tetrapisispora blattae CBS 6284]